MALTTGLVLAGVAGGAAIGGLAASDVDAPDPLDPAKVGRDSLNTQIELAPDVYASEAEFRPKYAALEESILRDSLLGRQTSFDANKALASMGEEQRAQIEAEAARTGRTAAEWLTDHTTEQAANGDAVAKASLEQFSNGREGGLIDLYDQISPELSRQQAAANRAMREADIADVEALGGRAREAYLSANPELANQFSQIENRLAENRAAGPAGGGDPSLGVQLGEANTADAAQTSNSALLVEMERQAMEELQAGGRLTDQEQRTADQAVRASMADRGMVMSNQAIFGEALNRDSLQRERAGERRAFAGAVDTQLARNDMFNASARQQANLFNADSANQFDLTRYGNESGNARFLAEQDRLRQNDLFAQEMGAASLYHSTASDPFQMVLGRSGVPAATQGTVGQAGYSSQAGPSMFDPFNASILSMYSGNQANQLAANTATANNKAAIYGSLIGAVGSVGGGMAAGACWVAREVYGEEDPRWLTFRTWLLERAPEWLRTAYLAKGERFARLIHHRPRLRAAVRAWMEDVLAHHAIPCNEA